MKLIENDSSFDRPNMLMLLQEGTH